MSAVHIEDLRVAAGPRVLLRLPRLQLAAGEHLVIVGPNGAGKSTLLRCLGGFVRPAQGQVQVLGRTLAPGAPARALLRAHRRDVGQVLQGLHLVARLTVLENTLIGALGRLHGGAAWRSCWRQYPAPEVEAAMAALQALQARPGRRVWLCGSYAQAGVPLLESAVRSASEVARAIDATQGRVADSKA